MNLLKLPNLDSSDILLNHTLGDVRPENTHIVRGSIAV